MKVRIYDSKGRLRGVYPNMESALLSLPYIRKRDMEDKEFIEYIIKESER